MRLDPVVALQKSNSGKGKGGLRTCRLRIIPSARESGKILLFHHRGRGLCHDSSAIFLLGRVDELFDDHPCGHEMNEGQKGLAQFLIPCRDASKLFEVVAEPFDLLAQLIALFIIVVRRSTIAL